MRKVLLASAAVFGATGGLAFAQAPAAPAAPTQGTTAAPWAAGPGINNNIQTQGFVVPGGNANPAPGTVVIRLNGMVQSQIDVYGGSLNNQPYGQLSGTSSAAQALGGGGHKLNPVTASSFFRLFPGIDGMATNGLRYGASVEIRENFMSGTGQSYLNVPSSNTANAAAVVSGAGATSASGVSSGQTLFVRRAFTYIGSDKLGILRIGQADGVVGLFNASGIFTTGSWDGGIGNLNNAGMQSVAPNQSLIDWPFLAGNGTEYGNNKIVYMSPQFFGFDFGVEYAPNMGNGYAGSATSSPYQVGPCPVVGPDCIGLASGGDGTRWTNRISGGIRYQGSFSGLDVKAYGIYVTSGKETTTAALKYDNQNFFNGGVALTYAGLTVNADVTSGRTNGSNGLVPTGSKPTNAVIFGVGYQNGPWSVGADAAFIDNAGSVGTSNTAAIGVASNAVGNLAPLGQRHQFAFAVGGAYRIAPGINLDLEYMYEQKHQAGFNLTVNGVQGPAMNLGNDMHESGVTFATIVTW